MKKEELVRELILNRPRWFRWSSRYQPFTLDDYLQPERLRPFYQRMKGLTPGASKPKPSWGQKPNQKKENNPQPQTILDEFLWEVPAEDIVTCYAIVTEEEGTSEAVEAPPSADKVAKIVKEEPKDVHGKEKSVKGQGGNRGSPSFMVWNPSI